MLNLTNVMFFIVSFCFVLFYPEDVHNITMIPKAHLFFEVKNISDFFELAAEIVFIKVWFGVDTGGTIAV